MSDLSLAIREPHDPGGKVAVTLPPGVAGRALFGGPRDCFRYLASYRLVSVPADDLRRILWVMMNPSVANALQFDPTLFKCWKISRNLGFNQMLVGNVFAYRSTDQTALGKVTDPIGPENDAYLVRMAQAADMVVMAYGTPQSKLRQRGSDVARMFRELGIPMHVLGFSAAGRPLHPLYQPDDSQPDPWAGPDTENPHG